MHGRELARHILRMYEPAELEDAITEAVMTFDRHHHRWSEAQEASLNRAIVDRTLVAAALANLLTEVQIAVPIAPARLLQAEAEAIRALSIVGGPMVASATEPAVAEI